VYIGSESSPWDLAEGAPPAGPDQVVIDRKSAEDGDIEVGEQIEVTAISGARTFTVTGIATFAGSDTSGGATWALFDLPTAQEFVVGEAGKVDSIIVRGDGSFTEEQLKANLSTLFQDDDIEVLTGAEIIEENQSDIQEGLSFFTIFLTIFAAISLFVGSFIIFNVFSISAAQRQKENALLRAIGASRRQVTRTLFVEALLVGAVGGALGFAGGVGLAAAINAALEAAGLGPADTSLIVNPSVFVITLIVGVVVTLVCAIVPALACGARAAARSDARRRSRSLGALTHAVGRRSRVPRHRDRRHLARRHGRRDLARSWRGLAVRGSGRARTAPRGTDRTDPHPASVGRARRDR
jgi:putative ABC transport system permease protein